MASNEDMPLQVDLADIWESAIPDSINDMPPQGSRVRKHNSRIEVTNGRGYVWRTGSGSNRTSLYGGTTDHLKATHPDRFKQYERNSTKAKKSKEKANNHITGS